MDPTVGLFVDVGYDDDDEVYARDEFLQLHPKCLSLLEVVAIAAILRTRGVAKAIINIDSISGVTSCAQTARNYDKRKKMHSL